jgi:hypothetical protein
MAPFLNTLKAMSNKGLMHANSANLLLQLFMKRKYINNLAKFKYSANLRNAKQSVIQ